MEDLNFYVRGTPSPKPYEISIHKLLTIKVAQCSNLQTLVVPFVLAFCVKVGSDRAISSATTLQSKDKVARNWSLSFVLSQKGNASIGRLVATGT